MEKKEIRRMTQAKVEAIILTKNQRKNYVWIGVILVDSKCIGSGTRSYWTVEQHSPTFNSHFEIFYSAYNMEKYLTFYFKVS